MKTLFPLCPLGIALLLSQCNSKEETATNSKAEDKELSSQKEALHQHLKDKVNEIKQHQEIANRILENEINASSSEAARLYLAAFKEIQKGDAENLLKAREILEKIQSKYPDWKPEIVQARLQSLLQDLEAGAK
ncbi:hypothetical protein Rhal01_02528 [Rubritalea halochordaticola]|uniref:Lipoprotein n=1 Tax=Rubritalea halochordaticola TaxID=714537 RepID=A0ABP9V2V9_9BACT